MRLTFPYFIGPSTWLWHHFIAERANELDSSDLVGLFKQYIPLFATLYPCPYCRHHFNAYVIVNAAVERDLVRP